MQQRNIVPNRRQVKIFSGYSPLRETPKILGVLFSLGIMFTSLPEAEAGILKGKLVQKNDEPIAGAIVEVSDQDTQGQRLMGKGRTNAKGEFRVSYPSEWKDKDPGPFGSGSKPDIQISVLLEARYTTANFEDARVDGTVKTKVTTDPVGRFTKIHEHETYPNYDPNKDLDVGTIQVGGSASLEVVRTSFAPQTSGYNFRTPTAAICWGPTCGSSLSKLLSAKQAMSGGMVIGALERYTDGRCDTYQALNLPGGKPPGYIKKELAANTVEALLSPRSILDNDRTFKLFDKQLGEPPRSIPRVSPAFRQLVLQAQNEKTIGASIVKEWPIVVAELRDRKLPVVLGLINTEAERPLDFDRLSKNHHVLAIGYDHDPLLQAVTLYVYDPNAPGDVKELYFSYQLDKGKMYVEYMGNPKTRGFFVSTRAPVGAKPPKPCRGATAR